MKEKIVFLVAILTVLFQVFVFFPLSMWAQNQFNFNVSLVEGLSVISYVVLTAIMASLILTIITPKVIRKPLLAFFVILSVLIFFQQNVLVWNYGVLDGNNLNFSNNSTLGWIDVSFWIAGLVLLLYKSKFVTRHAIVVLIFSGVVSCTILLTTFSSYDFNKAYNTTSITDVDKFVFSRDKNVFMFVLDGFQSDLFLEIIDKEPELKDKLSGFTFYPNTAAVFAKTYPTIPLLLTGKIYQKKQPILEFVHNAYKDSLLSQLIDSGWNVGLYPHIKNLILVDGSVMDNYINKITAIDKFESYLQMLDLSLFRLVPHPIKKKVFNKGDFVVRKSLMHKVTKSELFTKTPTKKLPKNNKHFAFNFLENLKTFSTTKSNKPTFRYYHFLMPHVPFLLDRDLKYGYFNANKGAYKDYAYASLKLMIKYLDELKKIGIYDNSAILIIADHGGGLYMQNKYDKKTGTFVSVSEDGKEKASSRPLLLIKGFNSHRKLTSSNKPVSLIDIAPTIADFTNTEIKNQRGMVIDKLNEEMQRERMFYYFDFTGWDTKYLEEFKVYKINGDVYQDSSWLNTGLVVKEQSNVNNAKYMLDKIISYGTDKKTSASYNNKFLIGDNYKFTHSSVFATGQTIELEVRLDEPLIDNEIYELEVTLSSNKQPNKINLEANGKKLKTISATKKRGKYTAYFQIDNDYDKKNLNLRISPDEKVSNFIIGLSKFKLKKLKPYELTSFNHDNKIIFSSNIKKFQPKGFSKKEKWGRWSTKEQSGLTFSVPKDFCEKGYLQLNINRFYTNVDAKKFQVFINAHKLKLINTTISDHRHILYYDCSSYHNNPERNAVVNLTFHTDKVVSPSDVYNSKDIRKLGAGFVSLAFGNLKDMSIERK